MSLDTYARHMSLQQLVPLLQEQQAAKVDVVAPASAIRARDGMIELFGVTPVVDERGVTTVDGLYSPTGAADGQIADKLGIPVRYLRRLRERERLDLYDGNVNGWLHGSVDAELPEPDDRSFLLRLVTGSGPGQSGVLRAMVSNRYGIIDNLDVLAAVLEGVQAAGADTEIRSCDLTDSTMHAKVYSPQMSVLAPRFLANYRSAFSNPELEAERRRVAGDLDRWRPIAAREGKGYAPGAEPVVFTGFRCSNDETGHHAVRLTPELVVQICGNGLTIPMFAHTHRHVGERLDAGTVSWSQDTLRKKLAVITAETRDRVAEWLSPEFFAARVEELEQAAGAPVTQPDKTLEVLAKKLGFSETERAGILSHFISGGQLTAAGIANAVTSYSQTIPDPDRANALDDIAYQAMTMA
ncbi:hypothetical protein JK358_38045 [Nocardia sp. 2]|uniref:Uncharacterized protein n=1 Tax=Nocardia acididurans TaxID=2802282 RepID=A0ABS1MLG4_9NOCA|nr:hypothetical protein [Nocardia acididurans]MBL1080213.1 hypothetical protein [Nocardia acididurans]